MELVLFEIRGGAYVPPPPRTSNSPDQIGLKGNAAYFLKFLLWMKTMHYPNTIRSHFVTIVPMAPFTPKSTSKLRSALHIRNSIVIPRFISHAKTAQS